MVKMLQESEVLGYVVRARVWFFFLIVVTEAVIVITGVLALAFNERLAGENRTAVIGLVSTVGGSLITLLMAAMNNAGRVAVRNGKVVIEPTHSPTES
jgi:hypothetical protein